MTTQRVWILPVLMACLIAAIELLPQRGAMAPSAIQMQLPFSIDAWDLDEKPPSPEEIDILAADTEFSKAICFKARPGEYDLASGQRIPDRIDLSIVLSGHDLNNSIHRPERCMPAQGHVLGGSEHRLLELPNGHTLPTRRLLSVQSIPTNAERTEFASFNSVTYYFFVGHQAITQDHFARTFIDMKDRLFYGIDQRWAYVSVSMWYGKVPWIEKEISLEEADQKLQDFLKELAIEQIDWQQMR